MTMYVGTAANMYLTAVPIMLMRIGGITNEENSGYFCIS